VTKNLLFILWALPRLRRHFRAAAAQTDDWRRSVRRRRPSPTVPNAAVSVAGQTPGPSVAGS